MHRSALIVALLALLLSCLAICGAGAVWLMVQHATQAHQSAERARLETLSEQLAQERSQSRQGLDALRLALIKERQDAEGQRARLEEKQQALSTQLDRLALDQHGAPPNPVINWTPAVTFPILNPPPAKPFKGRAWGPEQATGEPDTFEAGDMQTAWASRTQDGQPEWLLLDYEKEVKITKVKVHETYNPGALEKISVVDDDGKEIEVWRGKDPTAVGTPMGLSEVTLAAPTKGKRIKIFLDSVNVPGWNEIDAVGIVDDAGATLWAVRATASSTYAENFTPPAPQPQKPPRPPEGEQF